MPRPEKEAVVNDLKERFTRAQSVVLADYRGLTASEMNQLRRQLRAEEVELRVVKNRLFRRALDAEPDSPAAALLVGPIAAAFGYGDPIAPAKILVKAKKDLPALEVRGGFMDGEVLSAEDVERIAALPGREELMGQIQGSLLSPLYATMLSIQNVMGTLTATLKAYAESLEQGE